MFAKDHLNIIEAVAMVLFRHRDYGPEKWQRMHKRIDEDDSNGVAFMQEAVEDENADYDLYIIDHDGKECLGVDRCEETEDWITVETLGYVALGPRDLDAVNLGDYCKAVGDLIESRRH